MSVAVAKSAGSLVGHNQLLNTCSDQHTMLSRLINQIKGTMEVPKGVTSWYR